MVNFVLFTINIVCKGVSTTPKIMGVRNTHTPLPPPPPLTSKSVKVFLINRNATVKLHSLNSIHVKQKYHVGFFTFKFTLKYMLGNVYINKIHARKCFYISLYCREGFFYHFNSFVTSKGILHV